MKENKEVVADFITYAVICLFLVLWVLTWDSTDWAEAKAQWKWLCDHHLSLACGWAGMGG